MGTARFWFDGEKVAVCDSCGFVFGRNHLWSEKPFRTCAACGATGPFRQPTDADFAAYAERIRAKPSDYLMALVLVIVIGGVVAIITKWVVDA